LRVLLEAKAVSVLIAGSSAISVPCIFTSILLLSMQAAQVEAS
jgi:hypothetical protein